MIQVTCSTKSFILVKKKTDNEMEDGESDVDYLSGAVKYFIVRELDKAHFMPFTYFGPHKLP
jgi:hypothetical protein